MPRSSRPELRLRLQHHRAGAIAEQHAGAAVLPIEDARERLGTDHDGALELAGLDEVVGDRQGVDEARADGCDVEGRALDDAEAEPGFARQLRGKFGLALQWRRRRDRCRRGSMPALMRAWRAAACPRSEVSSPSAGNVALLDARALLDPLVASIDHAREVGVGQTRFGRWAPTPRITDRMTVTVSLWGRIN